MANIRADVTYTIKDGSEVVFKSPCDCSAVTGLIVYYPSEIGETKSHEFKFADAHKNDVSTISELFKEDVIVKVILDTVNNMAYVQNADTNAYLEGKFEDLDKRITNVEENGGSGGNTNITASQVDLEVGVSELPEGHIYLVYE